MRNDPVKNGLVATFHWSEPVPYADVAFLSSNPSHINNVNRFSSLEEDTND